MFSYRSNPHAQTRETSSEMLLNRKVNARMNMIDLIADPIKQEQKMSLSQASKNVEYYTQVIQYAYKITTKGIGG